MPLPQHGMKRTCCQSIQCMISIPTQVVKLLNNFERDTINGLDKHKIGGMHENTIDDTNINEHVQG